jgi:hypothetical protein
LNKPFGPCRKRDSRRRIGVTVPGTVPAAVTRL